MHLSQDVCRRQDTADRWGCKRDCRRIVYGKFDVARQAGINVLVQIKMSIVRGAGVLFKFSYKQGTPLWCRVCSQTHDLPCATEVRVPHVNCERNMEKGTLVGISWKRSCENLYQLLYLFYRWSITTRHDCMKFMNRQPPFVLKFPWA